MATPDPKWLAWIDLETTGLDPDTDHIIEFACVVTDLDLKVYGHMETLVRPSHLTMEELLAVIDSNPFINKMHTENGLKAALKKGPTLTINKVEESLVGLFQNFGAEQEFLMAGSGVASFDKPWLDKVMPTARKFWQYRTYDIGNMRRFVKYTLGREDILPPEPTTHRSAEDVAAFIEQAETLRSRLVIK